MHAMLLSNVPNTIHNTSSSSSSWVKHLIMIAVRPMLRTKQATSKTATREGEERERQLGLVCVCSNNRSDHNRGRPQDPNQGFLSILSLSLFAASSLEWKFKQRSLWLDPSVMTDLCFSLMRRNNNMPIFYSPSCRCCTYMSIAGPPLL